ncbi:MAG TPA: MarR family transcriptional regulator [Spirochaetia bacterium]|nr:MarR family transcriptional regulator [Spirochaetia bacterium]
MTSSTDARSKLIEDIQTNLHRINRSLHRHMHGGMEGLPVTLPQLGLLWKISQQPGLTLSEVARQLMMTKSNISVMVDRLAREGLLEKRPDAADQRLTRLHASDAGQELLKTVWTQHLATAQTAMAGLSDQQLAEVAGSLALVYDTLAKNLATGGGD